MTDKIKRYKKVTEWSESAITFLIFLPIILFLSVAFLWSNWDEININNHNLNNDWIGLFYICSVKRKITNSLVI